MYNFDVKRFAYYYLKNIGEDLPKIFDAYNLDSIKDLNSVKEIMDFGDERFRYKGNVYRFMDEYLFECYTNDLIKKYIDKYVLLKIPEGYRKYFDIDMLTNDIENKIDFIPSDDGNINEFIYKDELYHVWREY